MPAWDRMTSISQIQKETEKEGRREGRRDSSDEIFIVTKPMKLWTQDLLEMKTELF